MTQPRKVDKRLVFALASYGVLGLLALIGLDGYLRIVVLVVLGLFAVKTLVHSHDEPMG